jgi:hypothetical protein
LETEAKIIIKRKRTGIKISKVRDALILDEESYSDANGYFEIGPEPLVPLVAAPSFLPFSAG